MTDDEIPRFILAQHPEMAEVGEALRQVRGGRPVTARCRVCGGQIHVTEVAATG
jgi:hypothetical protein